MRLSSCLSELVWSLQPLPLESTVTHGWRRTNAETPSWVLTYLVFLAYEPTCWLRRVSLGPEQSAWPTGKQTVQRGLHLEAKGSVPAAGGHRRGSPRSALEAGAAWEGNPYAPALMCSHAVSAWVGAQAPVCHLQYLLIP